MRDIAHKQFLVVRTNSVRLSLQDALLAAVQQGHEEIVAYLLSADDEMDPDGMPSNSGSGKELLTPLMIAARDNRYDPQCSPV
jgi:hypothetical protein